MTNVLSQRKGETLEQYVQRIKNMNNEEIMEAAERQRSAVLEEYHSTSKESNYKRKVYHK